MPDNKKDKNKNEPKEQRKPRQRHLQKIEKQDHKPVEKKCEEPVKATPKFQEPGPEFYSNLKRETDEILKITNEENAKYKKKEIQSNWQKYELPIPSYEDIEEQENMGEDFEKLIQDSLSTGGHFQFQHEKSWNATARPTEYDKYFDIDPETLAMALLSIPFHERNNISTDLFSEYEMTNMLSRAAKYQERYQNELHKKQEQNKIDSNESVEEISDIKVEKRNQDGELSDFMFIKTTAQQNEMAIQTDSSKSDKNATSLIEDKSDDLLLDDIMVINNKENAIDESDVHEMVTVNKMQELQIKVFQKTAEDIKMIGSNTADAKEDSAIIKPAEDLEKWLDDFLDS